MPHLNRLRSVLHHVSPYRASMSTIHNTNAACCSIPPVKHDYTPHGAYKSYGDFKKVYITGPDNASSKSAIVCAYDIFGFFPQTQQGADILATALNTRVYMPDFFEPASPFPPSKYPPKTEQDNADIQAFFGGPASPTVNTEKLLAFGKALRGEGIDRIGAYGFCWGGKIAIRAGGPSTPFSSVAMVHPAMMSVQDAETLTVPVGIYISKDEPISEYNKMVDVVSEKSFASQCDNKVYPNM
ncbi:hypothetical protein BDN72DRAFT_829888 [Pluteus cervinus]|uniref:Uncharacterized protein n=1 Tax=Pluteus cervinus TaxID=181527 RepID=A0ACD3BFC2_9AGAR|nr:hypothetical protein BDN72DRAFT_829888 [Pluteus cervinus]